MLTAELFDSFVVGGRDNSWRKTTRWRTGAGQKQKCPEFGQRLPSWIRNNVSLLQELSALGGPANRKKKPRKAKRPFLKWPPSTNMSTSGRKGRTVPQPVCWPPRRVPVRWENRKTGRAGYSPACFNDG